MAKFNVGDKVRVISAPVNWPPCSEFTLLGAEGTVGVWVDWPEVMDPYSEYVYVKIDKADGKAKQYEGAYLIFHDHTLQKI